MRLLLLPVLLLSLLTVPTVGCTHPPPQLGPVAVADYQKTRVIKVLDVLRDAAVDANALTPQPSWASDSVTRRIVQGHKAILQTMDALGAGWQAATQAALDNLQSTLTAQEHARFDPYFALVKTLLAGVS